MKRYQKKHQHPNSQNNLLNSIKVTSRCRYNAAIRLENIGKFSFFTTTFLSLGLILLPLIEISNINTVFSSNPKALSMAQIFLAVSILVYSVVIGTAKYDLRSNLLSNCGDNLKSLVKDIEININTNGNLSQDDLFKYNKIYTRITRESENHKRTDYLSAILESSEIYDLSKPESFWLIIKEKTFRLLSHLLPLSLIVIEITLITDIFGISKVFSPYLNNYQSFSISKKINNHNSLKSEQKLSKSNLKPIPTK